MSFAAGAGGATPLGTPTHRRGFIDAAEFVRRLAAHQAAGAKSSREDFLVGLMRLAPESAAQARRELRSLAEDPLSQALRCALGEDVKVRDPELSGAAQRMRAICSEIDSLKFAWKVESLKFGNNKTHTRVAVQLESDDAKVDPVTAMAISVRKVPSKVWYDFPTMGGIDEGSILYFASLLPADLEVLFVDAACLLSRNLDWWEAQWENAAYLRQLLHSDVPMKPMATLVLAIGLAGRSQGRRPSRSMRWCRRTRKAGSMSHCSPPTFVSACVPNMPLLRGTQSACGAHCGLIPASQPRYSPSSVRQSPRDPRTRPGTRGRCSSCYWSSAWVMDSSCRRQLAPCSRVWTSAARASSCGQSC